MISTSLVLFVAAFFIFGVAPTRQEVCEPGLVTNLQLNDNYTLTWETPEDEQCDISSYIVYMTFRNGTVHYTYTVLLRYIHFNNLPSCESYTFSVHQISRDNVTGAEMSLYVVTPPPSEANLALEYVSITDQDGRPRLEWSLEEEWQSCASRYRVIIYNEDTDDTLDIYTQLTNITLNSILPCTRYTIGVVALFTLVEQGPISALSYTGAARVTNTPVVLGISVEQTRVNIEWQLEELSRNRCPISTLAVDGSPSFNLTYTIQNQENRTPCLSLLQV
ncbi:hypothetical protein NQ318_017897 [Aromia moschata]|uniref:Fibronectin type-III domain-containing protein n=1 Tax=Aromia moschata TaxID=1265417 RepID=A0AAV8YE49_9CUCU|nr:hypothetical protein NQ318_017897 [Aromia moschata]